MKVTITLTKPQIKLIQENVDTLINIAENSIAFNAAIILAQIEQEITKKQLKISKEEQLPLPIADTSVAKTTTKTTTKSIT